MDQLTLGQHLRRLRKLRGLTQDDLGGDIGVKRLTIIKWENDETQPSARHLKELSDYFKVDMLSLVEGEKKKSIAKGPRAQKAYATFSGLLHLVSGLKYSTDDLIMKEALKDLEEKIRVIMSERFDN